MIYFILIFLATFSKVSSACEQERNPSDKISILNLIKLESEIRNISTGCSTIQPEITPVKIWDTSESLHSPSRQGIDNPADQTNKTTIQDALNRKPLKFHPYTKHLTPNGKNISEDIVRITKKDKKYVNYTFFNQNKIIQKRK